VRLARRAVSDLEPSPDPGLHPAVRDRQADQPGDRKRNPGQLQPYRLRARLLRLGDHPPPARAHPRSGGGLV